MKRLDEVNARYGLAKPDSLPAIPVAELGATLGSAAPEGERIARFLAAGLAGFAVDASILAVLVHMFGIDPLVSRVPSFLASATLTWWLNRNHTFKGLGRLSPSLEYRRYITMQVIGASANLGVYAAALAGIAYCARYPVAAAVLGSVLGAVVNYTLNRLFVFPGGRHPRM